MFRLGILLFILTCSASYAQVDTSRGAPLRIGIAPKSSRVATNFCFYSSGWTDVPGGIKIRSFSPGYSASIFYIQPVAGSVVTLLVGPSLSYVDFHFNGQVHYTKNHDSTWFEPMESSSYIRNKMSLTFLDLPFEVRFLIRKNKKGDGFFITPGVSAGLLINDYIKTTGEDQHGHPVKQKIYFTNNLSTYRYGLSMKAGYGPVGIFGYYSLSELFEKHRGVGTNFYHIGIILGTY